MGRSSAVVPSPSTKRSLRRRDPGTVSASAAETVPGSLLLRLRFVDGEGTTAELRPIQRADGLCRFFLRGHFHEPEAARLACELIGDHFHRRDSALLGKQLSELLLGCRIR